MKRMKGRQWLALLLAVLLALSCTAMNMNPVLAEGETAQASDAAPEPKPAEEKPSEEKPAEEKPAATEKPDPTPKPEPKETPTPTPTPSPTPSPTPEPTEVPVTPTPASSAAPETPDATAGTEPEASAAPLESAVPETTPDAESTSTAQPQITLNPEASASPDTSAAPEATLDPYATLDPNATLDPSASPEASVSPSPSPTPEPPHFELRPRSEDYSNLHLNPSNLRIPSDGMPIPMIFQYRYSTTVCEIDGESKSVSSSGCGAAAASMLIAYIKENYDQTPYTLFYDAASKGQYDGDGLDYETIRSMLSRYGVDSRMLPVSSDGIINALNDQRPIIIKMGPGTFTNSGHYIVLRGLNEEGKVLVNDPASEGRSSGSYSVEKIVRESRSSHMIVAYTYPKGGKVIASQTAMAEESPAPQASEVPEEVQATPAPQEGEIPETVQITPAPQESEAPEAVRATPSPAESEQKDASVSAEQRTETAQSNASKPEQDPWQQEIAVDEPLAVVYDEADRNEENAASYLAVADYKRVNLREGPGEDTLVVNSVAEGTELWVIGEERDAEGRVWCAVIFQGRKLYMLGDLLRPAA